MLVEFECTNIAHYDAGLGRYVPCGRKIVVADDKIGQMVDCPGCNQKVQVPFDVGRQSTSETRAVRDKNKPSVASQKSVKKPRKAAPAKRVKNEMGLPDPTLSSDLMTFDFEKQQTADVYRSNEQRCPKCGSPMTKKGKCTQCRYVEQQFESAYLDLESLKLQPAGFQKWFLDIISEGVSITLLEWGLHCLLAILFGILVLAGILLGGKTGIAICISVALLALAYLGFVYKGHDLRSNPRAKLAWFQKPFWNAILHFARLMNWQNYDRRLRGRKIIDRRRAPLVDENIPTLEGLAICHVLDLEGTLVTDRSLRCLYGLRYLRCLVLRKTKVTHEGVLRLQQANPKLWIWY